MKNWFPLAISIGLFSLLACEGPDEPADDDTSDDDATADDDDTTEEWAPTFEGSYTFRYDAARSGASTSELPPSGTPSSMLWSKTVDPTAGIAVAGETIFLIGSDGITTLSIEDGSKLWTAPLDTIYRTPTIAGGRLFTQSGNGRVVALDAANGDELWRAETGEEITMQPSPLVVDDVVYVGGGDWNDDLAGMYALDASSGEELWSYRDEDRWDDYDARCAEIGAASLVNGALYFATVGAACANQQCDHESITVIYALNANDGSLEWKTELTGTWHYDPIAPLPITDEHVLLGSVIDESIGSTTLPNGKLIALNRSGGSQAWMVSYGSDEGKVYWNPAAAAGAVYIGIAEWDGDAWHNQLAAYDETSGDRLWTAPYSGYCPTVVGPYVIYNEDIPGEGDDSSFTVLRTSDGSVVTQHPLSGEASEYLFPIVHGGVAYVLTASYELYAIQLPSAD